MDYTLATAFEEDEEVVALRKILRRRLKAFDTELFFSEIETVHASRLTRSILTKEILADQLATLVEANMQNQAYRSRLVEIKIRAVVLVQEAENFFQTIEGLARSSHAEVFRTEAKTLAAKQAVFSRIFQREHKYLSNISALMKVIDVVIDDLDQAGWALKRVGEALQLANGMGSKQ